MLCSFQKEGSKVGSNTKSPGSTVLSIDAARKNQDKALTTLGLYRYKIPGDGNCLFRAVASQLRLDQDKYHKVLRQAAAKWMAQHGEELLASGLLDNMQEVMDTAQLNHWPGQAALVALANALGLNIAIIQGGDQGTIDIQHITPLETSSDADRGGILLAYLYNGHYDAVVHEPNLPNPDYTEWVAQRQIEREESENLALRLAGQSITASDKATTSNEMVSAKQPPAAAGRIKNEMYVNLQPQNIRQIGDDSKTMANTSRQLQRQELEAGRHTQQKPLRVKLPPLSASAGAPQIVNPTVRVIPVKFSAGNFRKPVGKTVKIPVSHEHEASNIAREIPVELTSELFHKSGRRLESIFEPAARCKWPEDRKSGLRNPSSQQHTKSSFLKQKQAHRWPGFDEDDDFFFQDAEEFLRSDFLMPYQRGMSQSRLEDLLDRTFI